jgi:hypothetical protein
LLAPDSADIRAAGVAGFVRPVDRSTEKQKYYVQCFGRSCDGLTMEIVTGLVQPIPFLVAGYRPGLPSAAGPLVARRPPIARPQYTADQTIAATLVWL